MSSAYVSSFTGDELDLSIARALGSKYRGSTTPGCHLVGDNSEFPQNLGTLSIPGKYTMYYYEDGPKDLQGSVNPIFVKVYWSGQMLYQTITVGAKLYWRDILSGDLSWKKVDMGTEAMVLSNTVDYRESGESEALTQRMGTYLKSLIEDIEIGNVNLLDYTNGIFGYADDVNTEADSAWDGDANHYIAPTTDIWHSDPDKASVVSFTDETLSTDAYINHDKFPMVDDLDENMFSVFRTTASEGVFTSYVKTGLGDNPVHVANGSTYTASIYLLMRDEFLTMDDSCKAYIKLFSAADASDAVTTEVQLNRLGPDKTASGLQPYCYDELLSTVESPVYKTPASDIGYYRMSVTIKGAAKSTFKGLRIQFGFTGSNAIGDMVFPKIEYGEHATQYNHSWHDLKYFFGNCETIYDRPINVLGPGDFKEQHGLVYSKVDRGFNSEPVAVGGGGGFIGITSKSRFMENKRYQKVLAYLNSGVYYNTENAHGVDIASYKLDTVCYGGDKVVTIAAASPTMLYSTDDINNWTKVKLPVSGTWKVAYGGNTFVGASSTGTTEIVIITSTDGGLTWSAQKYRYDTSDEAYGYLLDVKKVIYANDMFVIITNGGRVLTSTDGKTFTAVTTLTNASGTTEKMLPYAFEDICYSDGKFVISAKYNNKLHSVVSTDATTWNAYEIDATPISTANGIGYVNDKFIITAEAQSAATITMSSVDGVSWVSVAVDAPTLGCWKKACCGNGNILMLLPEYFDYAVDDDSEDADAGYIGPTEYLTSSDGTTWTLRLLPEIDGRWNDICYAGDKYVAVGDDSSVAYSADGATWTLIASTTTKIPMHGLYAMGPDGSIVPLTRGAFYHSATAPTYGDDGTVANGPYYDGWMDPNDGWLDSSTEDDSTPATLKYYDAERGIYRAVGADISATTGVWYMSETPDNTKTGQIWVKSSTRAPYIYDKTTSAWQPLLAVWGGT